jgi:hypothetical protein
MRGEKGDRSVDGDYSAQKNGHSARNDGNRLNLHLDFLVCCIAEANTPATESARHPRRRS